jgi:hypothetical protein
MTRHTEELKPCRWCKNPTPEFENDEWENRGKIVCGSCGASGPGVWVSTADLLTLLKERAIRAWNERSG